MGSANDKQFLFSNNAPAKLLIVTPGKSLIDDRGKKISAQRGTDSLPFEKWIETKGLSVRYDTV